jgi:alpha-amylase/alpha-mannosidase (GH57 family)
MIFVSWFKYDFLKEIYKRLSERNGSYVDNSMLMSMFEVTKVIISPICATNASWIEGKNVNANGNKQKF